jgi:hypothetical protein
VVDREDSTEEEIRAHVRMASSSTLRAATSYLHNLWPLPGRFYPQADRFINDEIDKYNQAVGFKPRPDAAEI